MASYSQVFQSILAMDAYHRENNQGVFHTNLGANDGAIGTSVGDYTLIATSLKKENSFYAVAYKNNATGEIIISYRGTDGFNLAGANDIFGGRTIGAGVITPSQLPDAIAFYERVIKTIEGFAGKTVYDCAPPNVTFTGHSLGGGLAGVVASLSGAKAYVIDPMPYTIA